jgi:hypothetical protein
MLREHIKTGAKILLAPVYVPLKIVEIVVEGKFIPIMETSTPDSGRTTDEERREANAEES